MIFAQADLDKLYADSSFLVFHFIGPGPRFARLVVKHVCEYRRAIFTMGISYSLNLVATKSGPGAPALTWLLGELVFDDNVSRWDVKTLQNGRENL